MNVARSDKSVDPWPFSVFHGFPSRLDIFLIASRESADDRDIAVLIDGVADCFRYGLDCFEIFLRSGGKPSLYDVDAEFSKLTRDVEFFLGCECSSGRLFAVTESRIEDADVVGIGNAVRDVFGTAAAQGMRWERRRI